MLYYDPSVKIRLGNRLYTDFQYFFVLYGWDTLEDFVAAGGNGQSCDPAAKSRAWQRSFLIIIRRLNFILEQNHHLPTVEPLKI